MFDGTKSLLILPSYSRSSCQKEVDKTHEGTECIRGCQTLEDATAALLLGKEEFGILLGPIIAVSSWPITSPSSCVISSGLYRLVPVAGVFVGHFHITQDHVLQLWR